MSAATRVQRFVTCGAIVLAVLVYILTIRPGHDWGGDFALYIAHAINLVTGQPYADTGYVYNPGNPYLSPKSYPPVFPAMLAPVYQLFGLDLYAMKVAGILVFGLFLLLFSQYAARRLQSPATGLMLLLALAASPWFWAAKDSILPEFLFILLLYSAVSLLDRLPERTHITAGRLAAAALVGVVVYLAYGTRSPGIVIAPALLLHDLVRFRRLRVASLVIAAVFAAGYLAQNMALKTDASYVSAMSSVVDSTAAIGVRESRVVESATLTDIIVSNLAELKTRIPAKLYSYGQTMSGYWYNGEHTLPGRVLFAFMTLLAAAGLIRLLWTAPSTGDYFLLAYIAMLLVVPFQQHRYMLPLIPLYLLYIFSGATWLGEVAGRRVHAVFRHLPAFVLMVMAVSYTTSYLAMDNRAIADGVESAESRAMLGFIREQVPQDSLVIFHKPRPLALFTGRRAAYHRNKDMHYLWDELLALGATHLVVPEVDDGDDSSARPFRRMLASHRGALRLLFRNSGFSVYAIDRTAPAVRP